MGPKVLFMNLKLRVEEFLMNYAHIDAKEIRNNDTLLLKFIPEKIA